MIKTVPFSPIALWSLLILASFVPTIPQPSAVIGYLWQTEFALGGFIFLTLVSALIFFRKEIALSNFSRLEFSGVVLPLTAFTVWSGLSILW
ncbi:MAG TPA: hypothetical protein VNB22_23410, partial [Pyrinomonadaceae bacterium]|nr:hypothetical protein [Pyrinomonadaceae bacterium]